MDTMVGGLRGLGYSDCSDAGIADGRLPVPGGMDFSVFAMHRTVTSALSFLPGELDHYLHGAHHLYIS
ncbi:MAG: hypothetical protein ACLUD2_05325 [Clostridium sp.]